MRSLQSVTRRSWWSGLGVALALVLAGCTSAAHTGSALTDPPQSVSPAPYYPDVCAPVGADTSGPCLRVTLDAIDSARAAEGLRPLVLPSDFAQLTVPEQLFVAVDRERVDRGLAPFTGLSTTLDSGAQRGADASGLPPRPGRGFASVTTEWIGDVDNGLDADFQWLYNDGPDSGVPGCSGNQTSGCWADRQIVLTRFGRHHLVMGAAFDPTGDTTSEDRSGVLAGRDAGHLDPGRQLRLHLEAGGCGHLRREAGATEGDPRHRVRHRHPRPAPQRGTVARLHARVLRRRHRRLTHLH